MKWLILLTLAFSQNLFSWGKTGHRTVAEIADRLLTDATRSKVEALLDGRKLWMEANWSDDMRNLPEWKHADFWHWVTFKGREFHEKEPRTMLVNILQKIPELHQALKDGTLKTRKEQAEALKWLVHLVGDLHQPLHTGGRGEDQGGNLFEMKFFGTPTNLHYVWDEKLFADLELGFRELADFATEPTLNEIQKWNTLDVIDWAEENGQYLDTIYNVGPEKNVQWEYCFQVRPILLLRLRQAGVRLALMLEDIFGE